MKKQNTVPVIPTFQNRDIARARQDQTDNGLITILRAHGLFKTPKSQGGFGFQDMAGVYFAHSSTWQNCPHCAYARPGSNRNAYAVYSYRTIMYLFCSTCGYEYCNASWYSQTTRNLQIVLSAVYPAYNVAMAMQYAKEDAAKTRWNKDKRAGLLNVTTRAHRQATRDDMLDWYTSRQDVEDTEKTITHDYHRVEYPPTQQEIYDRDSRDAYRIYLCE